MNPWKRARLEHARAEVNRRALDKLTEEWQRLCAQQSDTARLLVDAEDARRALEDRLDDAQRAQAYCDQHHAPLVRAWQQRALHDPWAGLGDGWAEDDLMQEKGTG